VGPTPLQVGPTPTPTPLHAGPTHPQPHQYHPLTRGSHRNPTLLHAGPTHPPYRRVPPTSNPYRRVTPAPLSNLWVGHLTCGSHTDLACGSRIMTRARKIGSKMCTQWCLNPGPPRTHKGTLPPDQATTCDIGCVRAYICHHLSVVGLGLHNLAIFF
jgi:hypothetical protein